jgi:hypothetical protein
MLDSRPPMSRRIRLLNTAAKVLLARKWPIARFDEETLNNAAIKEIGQTDFGNPHYREGLRRLIDSAEREARPHFIGRLMLRGLAVTFLSNRLLLAAARKQTPEVFERPLIPPVIILGLPRTGTTLLHRLMALDPAHRAAPLWELLRPLPHGTPDRRRAQAQEGESLQQHLTPRHDQMHFSRADSPEECVVLQGTTFCSALFFGFMPVPSYTEWCFSHDQTEAYREYHSLLQVLQAVQPERRLVLKSPAHTGALPELFKTIPDALIIQTHRDPVVACNSANSAMYYLRSTFVDRLDVRSMAETTVRLLAKWVTTSLSFRENHPGVICDVQYDRLVSDPIGTVKDIYHHFKLTWSDAYEEQLRTYLLENPQGKHGTHRYRSDDFGLTDAAIARQFTEYSERFVSRC